MTSLREEDVVKASRDILIRAKACKESDGGPFEYKLKKFKRNAANEE